MNLYWKLISEIINNTVLGNKENKLLWKLCLDYDLNWFKNEIKNSLGTRSVIYMIYKN